MIDIRLVRENPGLVKENIKKKFQEDKIKLVDDVLKIDKKWRKIKYEEDSLRSSRNKVSKEISEAKKAKDEKKAEELMKKAKKIPEDVSKLQEKRRNLENKIDDILLQIPNIMHSKIPVGKDEDENVELKKWGKIREKDFKLVNHGELAEKLGLVDFDAGRKNSGQGFNYLLGDLALLDNALQRYGVDFLLKKGFNLVAPPMMLNFETLLGALNGLGDFEEVVYKIDSEDLYMIGTAEHSLVSLYKNRVLNKKDLPIKICAVTPCFRKEIGSHGLDTKGLFRMHQFNKVEQVVICEPEESYDVLDEIQRITEEFFESLEIPYRVIEICSGDLGNKFSKQYDIEAWFPRQKTYREVTSAGNTTDFQSRALNVKFLDKSERKYPHMLNNTMVATSRAMVAILENYQQKDGTIKIPKVLQPYMFEKKVIGKN